MRILRSTKPHTSIQERLLEFFPPPRFLNVAVAGIDVSDSSVKAMSFTRTKGGILPDFYEEKKISPGIVRGGEVIDLDSLVKVLTALRRKHNITFVRASLPEEKAYLFQTTIPVVENRAQMRTSIEFQLEEHVPISPEESIFDYDVIETSPGAATVSVTVFPKSVITNYREAFHRAGMTPVSFELEGQAIANAVIPRGDSKTYMIVDFGRKRSGIAIAKNGVVGFTSTVDAGGDALSEKIMEHFQVDGAAAMKIKNEKGLIETGPDFAGLHESLTKVVGALRDEINRHFEYWNSRHAESGEKEGSIEGIILCGGNASLKGLPEFLARDTKVPVTRADVWQNAFSYDEYIPQMSREVSLSYATAIGLALG